MKSSSKKASNLKWISPLRRHQGNSWAELPIQMRFGKTM
jgi:hypothetical protein